MILILFKSKLAIMLILGLIILFQCAINKIINLIIKRLINPGSFYLSCDSKLKNKDINNYIKILKKNAKKIIKSLNKDSFLYQQCNFGAIKSQIYSFINQRAVEIKQHLNESNYNYVRFDINDDLQIISEIASTQINKTMHVNGHDIRLKFVTEDNSGIFKIYHVDKYNIKSQKWKIYKFSNSININNIFILMDYDENFHQFLFDNYNQNFNNISIIRTDIVNGTLNTYTKIDIKLSGLPFNIDVCSELINIVDHFLKIPYNEKIDNIVPYDYMIYHWN